MTKKTARETYLDVLHAHRWNPVFTSNFTFIPLERTKLYEAIAKHSISPVLWTDMYVQVAKTLHNKGPCFFRLSSVSPKDVEDTDNPLLMATEPNKVFRVLMKSTRILDALDDDQEATLVLVPWNPKMHPRDEYRCFIFDGVCEAICNGLTESEPREDIRKSIVDYISRHIHLFPSDTVALDVCVGDDLVPVFIEFNPVDDELDTYGMFCRDVELSPGAMKALTMEPPRAEPITTEQAVATAVAFNTTRIVLGVPGLSYPVKG